jgi:ubiquinone/menaquinone biosynthesis C-methylase UbiE
MWNALKSRRRQPEWMDAPDADPRELRASLAFIRRINRTLGYTRLMLAQLRRLSHAWPIGQPIVILDVATGSADVPAAIADWARRVGLPVRIFGVDLHPATLTVAAQTHAAHLVRADARALPLADRSVDYAITAMFLHHLDESDAVAVLREMDRVSRRGILISDLLRTRRAYAWITLFTLAARPMVRHDARASVAGAFDEAEVRSLLHKAGLSYLRYQKCFGHRFLAGGERPSSPLAESHKDV